MCHLANVSYRTGRPLDVDSKTGHIHDASIASNYWQRTYRTGWFPGRGVVTYPLSKNDSET